MHKMALYTIIAFSPLIGSLLSGFFGKLIGKKGSYCVTIISVTTSLILSLSVLYGFLKGTEAVFNGNLYVWFTIDKVQFPIGFLVDSLTALMIVVVTSVSLMVHIYTIGYMQEDAGFQRFFSYISLFTFAMLMLVMSNNFIQLFFGWEAVGLISYLLIGFWYKKKTAIFANLKAFLVNRVGDFGFLLGIGLIFAYFGGSLNYMDVFNNILFIEGKAITLFPGHEFSLVTVIVLLLFIGAIGKSAQFPLHVWLPDSMEGPTPISALIHAATMVTAGIFMVSRMSPLYELSDFALNIIMIIGSITALFMGILGIIQNDIKRVIAYSTLSQLGYMTVALGCSVYNIAIFHVMTHAFFKALLFLAAGSVIIGMHHDQDMRNMGGLRKYMPITWITLLIGNLSLIAMPFFSGFYSKDSIIDAVSFSRLPAHKFAYWSLIISVFVTSFYSFRLYFLVFHGKERWRHKKNNKHEPNNTTTEHKDCLLPDQNPCESPLVITLPLILLAIPSVLIGIFFIDKLVYGDFFANVINMDRHYYIIDYMREEFNGIFNFTIDSFVKVPFYLSILGVFFAWLFYLKFPNLPKFFMDKLKPIYILLDNKYYLDNIYYNVFARGARLLGRFLWQFIDVFIIDSFIVNGISKMVIVFSSLIRRIQTGFIYTYAMAMIIGLLLLIFLCFIPNFYYN